MRSKVTVGALRYLCLRAVLGLFGGVLPSRVVRVEGRSVPVGGRLIQYKSACPFSFTFTSEGEDNRNNYVRRVQPTMNRSGVAHVAHNSSRVRAWLRLFSCPFSTAAFCVVRL